MKTLLLLRHARSSREDRTLEDRARPLHALGREQAREVGRYMANEGLVPDLALVSTALRTRETWDLASSPLDGEFRTEHRDSLYLAAPETLLDQVRDVEDDTDRVLLVGHNPGMAHLARGLAGRGTGSQMARLRASFPTGGLAVLTFDVDRWHAVRPGKGALERFVRPGR